MKFYDWENAPAYWAAPDFPRVVTLKGDRVIWDLCIFFMNATPVSKDDFIKMKETIKK